MSAIAIRGAAFTIPASASERPQLRGTVCPACGARFPGRRAICLACGRRGLDDCLLSPFGSIWTFTIVHQKPPGAIVEPPYAIAQVKLDDGPVVLSVVTGVPLAEVRVGLPVEMALYDTGREEEGSRVYAFAFQPRGEAA